MQRTCRLVVKQQASRDPIGSFCWCRHTDSLTKQVLLFFRKPSAQPLFFDHADEYILKRETALPRAADTDSVRFEFSDDGFHPAAPLGDHVKPVAEQGYSPALEILPQRVRRLLRLIHMKLQ